MKTGRRKDSLKGGCVCGVVLFLDLCEGVCVCCAYKYA